MPLRDVADLERALESMRQIFNARLAKKIIATPKGDYPPITVGVTGSKIIPNRVLEGGGCEYKYQVSPIDNPQWAFSFVFLLAMLFFTLAMI
jgi:hypothetical protein